MKTFLIFTLLLSSGAFAAEEKVDMRQGTKAVDEKYLDDMTSGRPERKTISHDVDAIYDRSKQMESKRTRQFQEEDSVTVPSPYPELNP